MPLRRMVLLLLWFLSAAVVGGFGVFAAMIAYKPYAVFVFAAAFGVLVAFGSKGLLTWGFEQKEPST